MRAQFILFMLAAGTASSAHAIESGLKLEAHGFVSTTMYYQSTPDLLLNGQGALMATNPGAYVSTMGFDARQSRIGVSIYGPPIMTDVAPKAVLETDFMALDSPGSYGQISALPRLRLAYLELDRGSTTVRIGQDWELMNCGIATSLSRIAYTLYGAGFVAWRAPGVGVFQNIDLGGSSLEVSGQILKSDWESPYAYGLTTSNDRNIDAGALSGWPGLEARVRWLHEATSVYLVGHWNQVAASHANQLVNTGSDTIFGTAPTRDFDVIAGKVGVRSKWGDYTLMAEYYIGKNLGPLLGDLLQFPVQNDIHEMGGWGQVGYDFTAHWSSFVTFGTSQPDGDDANQANSMPTGEKEGRLRNTIQGLLVQYHEGAFSFGPELFFIETVLSSGPVANQAYSVTANYAF